mgnify:CR=1 FL=1
MFLKVPLKRFYYSSINLLFPLRCLVCGKDINQYQSIPLCEEHLAMINLTKKPFCEKCGRKLSSEMQSEYICITCRDTKWHFDRQFSATVYNEVMQELVHLYKYGMRNYLASSLASFMIKFMDDYIDAKTIDFVIPVPLHWRRYLYRGFNQAYEIARRFSHQYSSKISTGNLRRIRYTTPQVGLSNEERKKNIRGAFTVINPERLTGKNILLIDDVFTTGATMNECARILKESGVLSVTGFTLSQPLVF